MEISVVKRKVFSQQNTLNEPSFFKADSIGFWAYVTEVHSESLTVNVKADNGFEYYYIPVASNTWVNSDLKSGSRYLPPIHSRVFVLTPTKTIQSAFVLCSGFGVIDAEEKGPYIADGTDRKDIQDKNESIKITDINGWTEEKENNSGKYTLTSKDGKISISIIAEDNTQKGEKKSVTINAWNNSIKITDENGIEINSNKKLNIKVNDEVTFDANGKNIDIKCSAFTINKTAAGTSDFSVG